MQEKPHKARGLCGTCYDKEYYAVSRGKKKKPKKKTCLGCDNEFVPEHEHNWICPRCTESNKNIHYFPAGVNSSVDSSF